MCLEQCVQQGVCVWVKVDRAEVNTLLHDNRLPLAECLLATSSKWVSISPSTSILFHPSFTCEMQKMAAKGVNNTFPWLRWQSNWNLYTFSCPDLKAVSEICYSRLRKLPSIQNNSGLNPINKLQNLQSAQLPWLPMTFKPFLSVAFLFS